MGCIYFNSGGVRGFVCGFNPVYRLPLSNGRRVFMEWHRYLGPTLFHDRSMNREIENWYEDQKICDAVEWFQHRGNET